MVSISRMACSSAAFASARSARWLVRKSCRLTVSSCSSIASTLTGPRRSSSCAKRLGFGAERVVVHLERLNLGQHVVERTPPLRLEPLADRRAAPAELRVAQLGLVQLVVVRLRAASCVVERVLGRRERFVSALHAFLGEDEAPLAVGESGVSRLEVQLPTRHLLGELRVHLRQVGQLGAERLEAARRRALFLRESMLAVVRHLETRLALRDLDLRRRASLAGVLVGAFGDGERVPRARPGFRGLENRA